MRESVTLFVSGEPKGQPRPRATIRGKHAGMYDPGTAKQWKCVIIQEWKRIARDSYDCPVGVSLRFYFARPKSHFGAKGLKASAPRCHTQKPDIDNLVKAVLDALTEAGAWPDDKLVCDLWATRRWATVVPGCEIVIKEAWL